MIANSYLLNPHLPGEPFSLETGGADVALLFHGLTATCSEVVGLGRALNQAGFAARAPLLPGHATNPAELNKVRWPAWIAAGEAVYRDLAGRYRRIFVGGESLGGLIALYLAAQHPEIAGVTVFSPALRLTLTRWQRMELRLIAPFVPTLSKSDLDGNTTWQGYKVNTPRSVIELLSLQQQVIGRLAQIRQPTLIVQGRNDRTIDPRSSEIVYEKVGSAAKELHWMENSGHCVLLDGEREAVFRLAIDFMKRVVEGSPVPVRQG